MPPNLSWGPCMSRTFILLVPELADNCLNAVVMEYTFDTCRCITHVLSTGLLTRYPNIRFLFSHNGGAFPYLAGRIGKQHIDSAIARNNEGKTLLDLLRTANIFFDTAVSAKFQYRLVEDLGLPKDHIVYATDYPYTNRQDTKTFEDGFDAPRDSGVFTAEELENGVVRENALKHLFPRLAREYANVR